MKRYISVYEIVNFKTGKSYVGSSINVYYRLIWHKQSLYAGTHHCRHLQNSWNKYGSDVFQFRELYRLSNFELKHCSNVRKYLLSVEQFYLNLAFFAGMQCNTLTIASGLTSEEAIKYRSRRTKEADKQHSKVMKKHWTNPDFRRRHSESSRKTRSTKEYREKRSQLTYKQWESTSYRKKMERIHQSKVFKNHMHRVALAREAKLRIKRLKENKKRAA